MERLTEKHYGTDGYFMKCSEDCANDDEMCGGCPYLDKIIDRLGAYEDTGLTPEQVVAQKWIPVTERLPDEWTDVLVWSKCGFCVVAVSLGSHGKWRESWTHMMIDDNTITHWMPLPEPPKEAAK